MWKMVNNDDTGSLITGQRLKVGDRIEIKGEGRVRTITYVMGSIKKGYRACFKGQGALPLGKVEWRLVKIDNNDGFSRGAIKDLPETCRLANDTLRNGSYTPCFSFRKLGASKDKGQKEFTVIGCDIGASEKDSNTGTVIMSCVPDGNMHKVMVIKRYNLTTSEAERTIPSLVKKYDVSYLVLDAPLVPNRTYDACHKRTFRPHEKIALQLKNSEWDQISSLSHDATQKEKIKKISERLQAFSAWHRDGKLKEFADCGRQIYIASDMEFIEDPGIFYKKGIFEGYPKMFFFPLLDGSTVPEEFADSTIYKKGSFDSAVLKWLLSPEHPERFWSMSGLKTDENDLEGILAREDDHIVCGLSMALMGVFYGLGTITFVRSVAGDLDFGHWTFPDWDMFKPWAKEWLRIGMQKYSVGEKAEVICYKRED